ncbi:CD276 antigen homolog isoform 2-T2 [Anableps anableps]
MASCFHLLLVIFFCCYPGYARSFIEVICDKTNIGQFDHQSKLTCVVKPTQHISDLEITLVVWRKTGNENPVAILDRRPGQKNKMFPGYETVLDNMSMSLLITNTKVEDEGTYLCYVLTNSGSAEKTTILSVTARYNTPTVDSINKKEIPNSDKTLICKAGGGYPQGQLRWFGEQMEWTKSAKLTVNKTANGLFELYSELPLLKGSTFSQYTCVVYNASGGKEDSAPIILERVGEGPEQEKSLSKIIAPAVVIGSLIVGLLLALLFFRRRSQRTHHEVSRSDPDVDPPPPYCEESKDIV